MRRGAGVGDSREGLGERACGEEAVKWNGER